VAKDVEGAELVEFGAQPREEVFLGPGSMLGFELLPCSFVGGLHPLDGIIGAKGQRDTIVSPTFTFYPSIGHEVGYDVGLELFLKVYVVHEDSF
jgi:hypothetical protein